MPRTSDPTISCNCGSTFRSSNKSRHINSDKYRRFIILQQAIERPTIIQPIDCPTIVQQPSENEFINEFWWDDYEVEEINKLDQLEAAYQELETQFVNEYKHLIYLQQRQINLWPQDSHAITLQQIFKKLDEQCEIIEKRQQRLVDILDETITQNQEMLFRLCPRCQRQFVKY